MKKKFNVTGTCIPKRHYMVNTSCQLNQIIKLIDEEEYFIINRPRQYGKTTTLYLLEKTLNENDDYFVISTSFEGVGDAIFENEHVFSKGFIRILRRYFEFQNNKLANFINDNGKEVDSLDELSYFISKFVRKINKNVVLMIDEVDKSSNNQIFMSFLGMLRNKYLLRNMDKDYTFSSVILAGVHDVKTLKLKLRPDQEQKYNSPWNIAADFTVDMSFSVDEIKTMLVQYETEKKVQLDKDYFAERLRFYTSGYPFLVSKLCKTIDETIMNPEELIWEKEYMDMAVKKLLIESNTNFDSLIKNIENNNELKALVKRIVLENDYVTYSIDNPTINLGIIYGIFKNYNGKVKINNRIYEQRIYNYMSSLVETSTVSDMGVYNQKSQYIKENGDLDVKKVLTKFAEFMKHEYSKKRKKFLEADGRLIFLAFISPIINGSGFAFKEVQGGEETIIIEDKEKIIFEVYC